MDGMHNPQKSHEKRRPGEDGSATNRGAPIFKQTREHLLEKDEEQDPARHVPENV
jgi:hypothetical protein